MMTSESRAAEAGVGRILWIRRSGDPLPLSAELAGGVGRCGCACAGSRARRMDSARRSRIIQHRSRGNTVTVFAPKPRAAGIKQDALRGIDLAAPRLFGTRRLKNVDRKCYLGSIGFTISEFAPENIHELEW